MILGRLFHTFLIQIPWSFAVSSLTCVKEAINFCIHTSSAFIMFITNDCTFWTCWCLYPYSLMFHYFCFVLPICFQGEFPSFFYQSCFCLLFLCMSINNEGYAHASPPYGTTWFSLAVTFCEKQAIYCCFLVWITDRPANGHITHIASKVDFTSTYSTVYRHFLFCRRIVMQKSPQQTEILLLFFLPWNRNQHIQLVCSAAINLQFFIL